MDLTRQFGAAVLGLEGVQRAVVRRLLHDAAHHGVDDVRRVLPQRFHGGETLGHPRPLIQQRGQLVERREVDGGHFRAGDLQGAPGIVEAGGGLRVAKECPRGGDCAPGRRGPRQRRAGGHGARIRVALVKAARYFRHQRGVGHGQRKDRHAIQRAAGGHHARRAEPALGRLQADAVVAPRRHAARPRSIGSPRERRQAARHHRRRPGAGSAADVVRVEGIGHGAVRRTRAHKACGELVQVGLADQDGSGGPQALHHRRVLARRVREFGACGRRRPACGVDVVLDGEWHAIQRQARQVAASGFPQQLQPFQLLVQRVACPSSVSGCAPPSR
ncbi:hypothetical protein G6F57_016835 [Rhizopus arrhizus]|nr:hypothetical protein G6F57_016835 [Rhizopus arrhizus]